MILNQPNLLIIKLKKKSSKKDLKKQLKLTCQTRDLIHKNKIIPWKAN
jgi:hypothetical protein